MTTLKAPSVVVGVDVGVNTVGGDVGVNVVGGDVGANVGGRLNSCRPEEDNTKVNTASGENGNAVDFDWPLTVTVMVAPSIRVRHT